MSENPIRDLLENDTKVTEITQLLFKAFDENDSGRIEKDELKTALSTLFEGTNIELPTDDQMDAALAKLDIDKSGDLDVNEFKAVIRQLLESLLED